MSAFVEISDELIGAVEMSQSDDRDVANNKKSRPLNRERLGCALVLTASGKHGDFSAIVASDSAPIWCRIL